MSKVFILFYVVNGFWSGTSGVRAYNTEAECQLALEQKKKDIGWTQSINGRCASVEYLLSETELRRK